MFISSSVLLLFHRRRHCRRSLLQSLPQPSFKAVAAEEHNCKHHQYSIISSATVLFFIVVILRCSTGHKALVQLLSGTTTSLDNGKTEAKKGDDDVEDDQPFDHDESNAVEVRVRVNNGSKLNKVEWNK